MASTPNKLMAAVPKTCVITVGSTSIEFDDHGVFSIEQSATNFVNQAGDGVQPMDGGNVSKAYTWSYTTIDSDKARANVAILQAGTKVSVAATFNKHGADDGGTATLAFVGRINSVAQGDDGGRASFTYSGEIFSTTKTLFPIGWS